MLRIPEDPAEFEAARQWSYFAKRGVPKALADEIAGLPALTLVPEIMQIADDTGERWDAPRRAILPYRRTFRVGRLLAAGARIVTSDHYESLALARSIDQIANARRDIVISALAEHGKEEAAGSGLACSRPHQDQPHRRGTFQPTATAAIRRLRKITVAAGLLTDLARDRAR